MEFIENGTTFFNPPLGTEMSINVGYGVGVMIGAYIAIGVTGGHMNPAVTLAMAIRGKTHWLKVRGRRERERDKVNKRGREGGRKE